MVWDLQKIPTSAMLSNRGVHALYYQQFLLGIPMDVVFIDVIHNLIFLIKEKVIQCLI